MGLELIDFSDPANPVQLAFLSTDFQPYGMEFVGDVLFVAAGFGGIAAFDISDPANPEMISALPLGSNIYDLIVIDDVAYLSGFGGGGISIDVSDPGNMEVLFQDALWGFLQGVSRVPSEGVPLDDNLIAYADGQHGLRIVDISEPDNMESWPTIAGSGQARDIAVASSLLGRSPYPHNVAYTAADFYGLNVYGYGYFDYIEGFRSSDRGIGVDVTSIDPARHLVALTTGEGGIFLFNANYMIVHAEDEPGADVLTLHAPYPNPTVGTVTFSFDLSETSDINLTVFDVLGRSVATVADGIHSAGDHTITFNTASLAGGMYIVRMTAGGETVSHPFTVLK